MRTGLDAEPPKSLLRADAAALSEPTSASVSATTAAAVENGGRLLVVCDAIGARARELRVAPRAVEVVLGRLASSGLLSSSGDEISSRLRRAFADANACVQDEAESSPSPSLATSLVVAVVADAAIVVGSLGNARGYAFSEGRLSRLTRDHTALAELHPAGGGRRLGPFELHNRDLLTRALGIGPEVSPDLTTLDTRPGALLLLCSEGLWASVTESDLAATLGSGEPPRELGRALLRRSGRTAARSQAALVVCRLRSAG